MKNVFLWFLLIPIVGHIYVSVRLWQMLPLLTAGKIAVVIAMVVAFALLFIGVSGVLDKMPMPLAVVFYEVGTSWIFILLYLCMLFLLLDFGHLVRLVPSSFLHQSVSGSLSVFFLMLGIFVYGYIHYNEKVRVPIELKTDKRMDKPIKMVMISDLHLGYHNRKATLHRWIDKINAESPDLILIAGDLLDGSIRSVDEKRLYEEFHRLKAPVYACMGNHDFYTGVQNDLRFCRQAGITMLRDTAVVFRDMVIVGRDDRTNAGRKELASIMEGIDRSKYIIELDHQPYRLEEAQACGVDFEFCGHTHYGQVWPISWITDLIYEVAFGPYQKGNTRYYVSSGLGIWGGKFRIGTQSEYLVATLGNDGYR
ncbi:metallophosphoesterase [Phocaeicola abscessus]|uniref:metallophosphoesterase n=1 Tax=Phocaeicola abscessus TaxID=555313 RepID=UPI0003859A7E|nr:metallophosphoesterase [Phocaeicola abscessus]EPT34085.1 calcineurin-like phosphoesterase family protein [Bacteroidetes bacterium oral taxon 272 str. F0290]